MLRWHPEDIERRKQQARDPQFLLCLERTLKRKCEDLEYWSQEHRLDPNHPSLERIIART